MNKFNKIGIIGGTGLENPGFLDLSETLEVTNEFGATSSKIFIGTIDKIEVCVLSRHGIDHQHTPSNINYRANIKALKDLQCDGILAFTACGSLREEFVPGDFFLPDQFIDFTRNRKDSFYQGLDVTHTSMAEPFSEYLRSLVGLASKELDYKLHSGGVVITIEGPRFSSKAESLLFRNWGCDIINMTTATECILANEMNIPYQSIAMITDYDCWRDAQEAVSMEEVVRVMKENSSKAIFLVEQSIKTLGIK